jgi:hypothetical protein
MAFKTRICGTAFDYHGKEVAKFRVHHLWDYPVHANENYMDEYSMHLPLWRYVSPYDSGRVAGLFHFLFHNKPHTVHTAFLDTIYALDIYKKLSEVLFKFDKEVAFRQLVKNKLVLDTAIPKCKLKSVAAKHRKNTIARIRRQLSRYNFITRTSVVNFASFDCQTTLLLPTTLFYDTIKRVVFIFLSHYARRIQAAWRRYKIIQIISTESCFDENVAVMIANNSSRF